MTKAALSKQELRTSLVIDRDNLDDCLVEQPELFFHAADAYVRAVAERDAAKFDLEVAAAELDKQLRSEAAKSDERITDAAIKQQIQAAPKLQKLQREYNDLRADAASWEALKEAFGQRSYMLRELVSLHVSRLRTNIEGRVEIPKVALADARREAAGQLRRQGYR